MKGSQDCCSGKRRKRNNRTVDRTENKEHIVPTPLLIHPDRQAFSYCSPYPEFKDSCIVQMVNQVLTFLGLIGVIVDPTTAGLGDSERAMGYEEPWDDTVNK